MRYLLALAVLLIAAPAMAQETHFTAGWGDSNLEKNGKSQSTAEILIGAEHQVPLSDFWFGVHAAWATQSESLGFAIRSYYGGGNPTGAYIGFGIATRKWSAADFPGVLENDTRLVGPELLLEFTVPEGTGLPVISGGRALGKIFYLTRIQGDHGVGEFGFGLDLLLGSKSQG